MFGSGGIEVEGLKDVAFALSPLTRFEAHRMISRTWAGRKLDGFRHLNPADKDAVVEALLRLSQLVEEFPQIAEVEVNPLMVLDEGEGSVAIDVRMRVEQ
jgi:acetyltransferase